MINIVRTIIFLGLLLFNIFVYLRNKNLIKAMKNLPETQYALVLGAGLEHDGSPTDILSDRVLSAVKLIQSGKVNKLILSGSSSGNGYNEVTAMEVLATKAGMDQRIIVTDHLGISTLDSLINFKNQFQDEKLIIVTQRFHLPRSLCLARLLGLNSYGFAADIYQFSMMKNFIWYFREFLAMPFNLLKFIGYSYLGKIRPI